MKRPDNVTGWTKPWRKYADYLEAENTELRLEIISAHGQAQTALEENAKLREAIAIADINLPCATHQCQLEIKEALAAALLEGKE